MFKKGEREYKNNYKPVSILSNVSKIFERIISGKYQIIQISTFPSINVDLGKDIARSSVKNGDVLWIMGKHLDYC